MNQGNGKYTALFMFKLGIAYVIATVVVNQFEVFASFELMVKLLITCALQGIMVFAEAKWKNK